MFSHLEVPVFSPQSASLAIAQHAARVELNREGSYPDGGLTPTLADLKRLVLDNNTGTTSATTGTSVAPIRVMIRPRGPPPEGQGPDFLYSDEEFEGMKEAIESFRLLGAMKPERGDGFVFGCLKEKKGKGKEGEKGMLVVDVERNRELVELAKPFLAVFHRAFDDVLGSKGSSVEQALQDLETCGFYGVLTSGGPGSAVNNQDVVAQIISAAPGKVREVIIGGGVRSSNVEDLKRSLSPIIAKKREVHVWLHSSCLTKPGNGKGDRDVVDEEEVKAIVKALA